MGQPKYAGLQAVVFDLDGTLADSLPDIAAALNVALRSAKLPALDDHSVRRMIGNGSRILVDRALSAAGKHASPTELAETVHDAFLAAYDEAPCVHTRLFPGAREALDNLVAHRIALGICTNKPQQITESVLRRLGIDGLFASVVGSNDGQALKPAPDMLRRVLNELMAEPAATVMVGDSGADARAAQAAGTSLILLEHGYCHELLADLGADAVLPGFADLPDALARVTQQAA